MSRKVITQPMQLRGSGADVERTVDDNNVPACIIIRVITSPRVSRGRAEIPEIAGRVWGFVVMVPRRRTHARLVSPPSGIEAACEGLRGSARVRVVPGSEDGTRNRVQ